MKIDVMVSNGERYYGSLVYRFCPLYKLDLKDMIQNVLRKYPTLKYRDDVELVIERE